MSEYVVKGADETTENVDILGVIRSVGEKVSLPDEEAKPFVEAGALVLDDGSVDESTDGGDEESSQESGEVVTDTPTSEDAPVEGAEGVESSEGEHLAPEESVDEAPKDEAPSA